MPAAMITDIRKPEQSFRCRKRKKKIFSRKFFFLIKTVKKFKFSFPKLFFDPPSFFICLLTFLNQAFSYVDGSIYYLANHQSLIGRLVLQKLSAVVINSTGQA
jgi:hypothetical protein